MGSGGLIEIFDADLKGAKEFEVLGCDLQLHGGVLTTFGFRASVEANRGFKNQEHIEAGISDVLDSFADVFGLGERTIDRFPKFFHQLL